MDPITILLEDLVRVQNQREVLLLRMPEIVAIRSCENYTDVIHATGRTITVRIPLKVWRESLPSSSFLQVHRTAMVNLGYVSGHESLGNKKWVLHLCGLPQPVLVGRLFWPEVRRVLASTRLGEPVTLQSACG